MQKMTSSSVSRNTEKKMFGKRPSQKSQNRNTKAVQTYTYSTKKDDFFIWHAVFFLFTFVLKREEKTTHSDYHSFVIHYHCSCP